jgi:hypothetical protein
MAKQEAESLIFKEKITTFPVNPIAIAASRNIIVQAKEDTEESVSGMLLRHGNTFGILYSTYMNNTGFERFSIAHELGHYFLEGHIDHVLPQDGFHASRAGFSSADVYEMEADHFAAGLLMPSAPFKRILNQHTAGLKAIEGLADICETSLTATAIRYAELTTDPIAIIMSTGSEIDYCFMSDAMKSLPDLDYLKKGTPVPKSTETASFNSTESKVLSGDRTVNEIDIMDWLGGKRSLTATEEVIGLGRYRKTLTVLSIESFVPEDEKDESDLNDDEIIAERWTPRF